MLIALQCGGMPFDGETVKTSSLGGSETAAHGIAVELAKQGHDVKLFTRTEVQSEDEHGVSYIPMGEQSEQYPMGELFHYYAENTPVDALIIQRVPNAFSHRFKAKLKLLWLHDLALKRFQNMVAESLPNMDGILAVSEWHADQIAEVYGVDRKIIHVLPNGIDLEMFSSAPAMRLHTRGKNLLFTNRPERGLENLVGPDGIMRHLLEMSRDEHLYVCSYDNTTPQMKAYYEQLWAWCEELKNVTLLGSLSKPELYGIMKECDLHVYPSFFEETSCITAMECMAARLPMLHTDAGALPETVKGAGTYTIPLVDGEVDIQAFVEKIIEISPSSNIPEKSELQRKAAKHKTWKISAIKLSKLIQKNLGLSELSTTSFLRDMVDKSDLYAILKYFEVKRVSDLPDSATGIAGSVLAEIKECYAFTEDPVWDEHYAKYYAYEDEKGANYGPESLEHSARYNHVANIIAGSVPDGTVVDYGCAHGHYTVNLAKRFPHLKFVGVDISVSNISKARKWAEDDGVENVEFHVGRYEDGEIRGEDGDPIALPEISALIAAEVLEHVPNPLNHVEHFNCIVKEGGRVIITTPYGMWEAIGYKKEYPWRAHVWHFDYQDIHDIYGHFNDFNIVNVPDGESSMGLVGSYVYDWEVTSANLLPHEIDYERKFAEYRVDRQTISCCMIVGNADTTILRCLESVMPYVDELCVYLDHNGSENTEQLILTYMRGAWGEKSFRIEKGEGPREIGFDEARNRSLEMSSGDWILWIDADEYLHNGHVLRDILKPNMFNGYAVSQHHMAVEPLGLLKTDMPVRVFRAKMGIRFLGKVHEHPELIFNEGVGHVCMAPRGLCIMHDGYEDELTRRKRFSRNLPLMKWDREVNPDRTLGKFLWLRDLAQMNQWELEERRGAPSHEMVLRAREGVDLWRELVKDGNVRQAVESLSYYSAMNKLLGTGFDAEFRMDTSMFGDARTDDMTPVHGHFANIEDFRDLLKMVTDEKVRDYDTRYK